MKVPASAAISAALDAIRSLSAPIGKTDKERTLLLLTIWMNETPFDAGADDFNVRRGRDGEVGIGQIMPFWFDSDYFRSIGLTDPEKAHDDVRVGAKASWAVLRYGARKIAAKYPTRPDLPIPFSTTAETTEALIRGYNGGIERILSGNIAALDATTPYWDRWKRNAERALELFAGRIPGNGGDSDSTLLLAGALLAALAMFRGK